MASACSFNNDNIPPLCQQVATKLDIISLVNLAQCLTPDQVSLIKQNLRSEISDLKHKITAEQNYLKAVKDDLNLCKEKIALMDEWEEGFQRLDTVLPVVKMQVNCAQNRAVAASNTQAASTCMTNDMSSSKNGIPIYRCIDDVEWNAVPSYLKLRLKLDQVNSFVQVLNKELIAKYTLLKKKKSTLKKNELSLRVTYEEQETSETKSSKLFFVVASDLKKANLPEKTISSMRAILRHCHRLREIRNGKTIMLVVTN